MVVLCHWIVLMGRVCVSVVSLDCVKGEGMWQCYVTGLC